MSISEKGTFITFEGIDGCGKTTQARMLLEHVKNEGGNAVLVREPGGTKISEEVRQVLLSTERSELTNRTEALLMAASRAQLTEELILPNLNDCKIVIADRYLDSTVAYQGGGRGLEISWLKELNRFATDFLMPDITFFVDILPEEALRRKKDSSDRIEDSGVKFQNRVRNAYLELAESDRERIVVVDGHENQDKIHSKIVNELKRRQVLK